MSHYTLMQEQLIDGIALLKDRIKEADNQMDCKHLSGSTELLKELKKIPGDLLSWAAISKAQCSNYKEEFLVLHDEIEMQRVDSKESED